METKLLEANNKAVQLAGNLLKNGELVAIPTETVYGLAANAFNEKAVKKIFIAKGRPQDNPLIVHVSTMEMLEQVVQEVSPQAVKLAEAFWPGPLTMILPKADKLAISVSGGLESVGVRMPAHKIAQEVITAAGVPLAAPSANLSGSPSPTIAKYVFEDMCGRIPLILDGGSSSVGVESTVLSLVGKPVVLRPGFITAQEIAEVLKEPVSIASAVVQPLQAGEQVASPGMKYKHYAPKAQITIIDSDFETYKRYVQKQQNENIWALCFQEEMDKIAVPSISYGERESSVSQAAALFSALRQLDENGAKIVFARMPNKEGVGLAVYNRLLRAAAFRVMEL